MTRIQEKDGQYRVTIPTDIIDLTRWNKGDELIFVPYLKEPDAALTLDTPILLKRIKKVEGDQHAI